MKILSINIHYFVAILRFLEDWKIFGQQKVFFGGQNSFFLGQEVHYYMVYFVYYTELNLQVCNYAQKRRICRKNSKYAPDEKFVAIFAFAERLPTSATLFLDVFNQS